VLFERNALRTFFACADDAYREAFGAAVFATFLHRAAAFADGSPEIAQQVADPFGEGGLPLSRGERWSRRMRERGLIGAGRHAMARLLLGPRAGAPVLEDGHLLMQLRSAQGFFAGIEKAEARRAELDSVRRVPDREIVARFPRLVVSTYPGDEQWLGSDALKTLLPGDWPLERRRLDEIIRR
jgi:hypothetical protein